MATDTHTIVIGAYLNSVTYFNVYLNKDAYEIAKYLYGKLDIDLDMHETSIKVTCDVYKYILDTIGGSYKTIAPQREIATNVENDVEIIADAYTVMRLWKKIHPTYNNEYDVPFMKMKRYMDHYYYVFYNDKEQRTVVVDGACSQFQTLVSHTGPIFPVSDWAFMYVMSKTMLESSQYPDAATKFKTYFQNKTFANEDSCKKSITAFIHLYL